VAGGGLKAGDRVGISPSANAALRLVAAYALARIGAVFLLLDPGSAAQLGSLRLLRPQPAWLEPGPAAADPLLRVDGGGGPMMILLSSGTTGAPKAMCRSHADHAVLPGRSSRLGRGCRGPAARRDVVPLRLWAVRGDAGARRRRHRAHPAAGAHHRRLLPPAHGGAGKLSAGFGSRP
jgi:hypothetical protein